MNLIRMPWARRERFARAVEAWRAQPTNDDTDWSADWTSSWTEDWSAERAVVRALRDAGATIGPDAAARERMRTRMWAGIDAATAGTTSQATAAVTAGAETETPSRGRIPEVVPMPRRWVSPDDRGGRTRTRANNMLVALAAAACAVVIFGGITAVLSRGALPGETLYGVKRTAESATIGLTFNPASQGYEHLRFATNRVSDVESLAARPAATPDSLNQFVLALTDFDADATAGTVALTSLPAGTVAGAMGPLRDWSAQQSDRLHRIQERLPAIVHARVGESLDLLHKITLRANDLLARATCDAVTLSLTDALGPLPAVGACDQHDEGSASESGRVHRAHSNAPLTPPASGATAGQRSDSSTSSPPLLEVPPLLPGLPILGGGG